MTDTPAPRKKSQKRQRDKRISAPCTADEFNAVAAKAAAAGLTHGAYARAALLGDAGPRAQRRLPVDAEMMRRVLAELGRYGNNWNQVAYKLNTGAAPQALQDEIAKELVTLRRVIVLNLEALGKHPHQA